MKVTITTKNNEYLINFPSPTFLNDLRNNLKTSIERKVFVEFRAMDNITPGKEGRELIINPNQIESIEINREESEKLVPKIGAQDNASGQDKFSGESSEVKQPLAASFKAAQERADRLNKTLAEQGR